jgi:hypothetical protein
MSRAARADQPGQPLAAARAGNEAELHFGQTELGLGMIAGDAVGAGERELQPGAQAGAVDGGHHRGGQGLHPTHHLLALETQPLGGALGGEGAELLDIRTGDETVRLARDEHRAPDGGVVPEADQQRLELDLDRAAQLVDRLTGQVERDDRDPVFHRRGEGRH